MEDDEIVADAIAKGSSDESEEAIEDCHSITPLQVFNALDISLMWFESQDHPFMENFV